MVARLVEEVGRENLVARNLGKGEMGAGQCDGDRTRRRVAKIIGKGPRGIVGVGQYTPRPAIFTAKDLTYTTGASAVAAAL